MEVRVASSAGFCFGVERAYNMVKERLAQQSQDEKIATFGELIHNNRVIEELRGENVQTFTTEDQVQGTVIIRSHGISNVKKSILKERAEKLFDATCPYVTKVHIVTQRFQKEGIQVVIVGDPKHPEMQGIIEDLDAPICVSSKEEAEMLNHHSKLGVVCQTTLRRENFLEICEVLRSKCDEIIIDDTICSATTDRQTAVRELAQQVEAMIVVGGKQSSNTKKLAEIASEFCSTQKIEYIEEIDTDILQGKKTVGVTAGASTPQYQIDEVVAFLKKL